MTCIIGILDNNDIYMGGDSIVSSGTDLFLTNEDKVFIKDKFIFGFSHSIKIAQVLQYSFIPPKHDPNMSDVQYMASVFVDNMIDCFVNKGVIKTCEGEVGCDVFELIVGYHKNLYKICPPNFTILTTKTKFMATGCGEAYAVGALDIMFDDEYEDDFNSEEKIIRALETAEKYSLIKPPFKILKLHGNTGRNIESKETSKTTKPKR
jgi:ATP-dependent protease HslVU (ClpYQ) peptidase subunit